MRYIPIASFKVAPKLRAGVGTVAWVLSKFVHPSKLIRKQSANRAKNHKLEGGVLVEEENKTGTISSSGRLFREPPKLHAGVGAVAWVMSKFVHPSIPIHEQSTNRVKNHKLEGGVSVEEDEKKVIRSNTERMGTSGVVGNWL
eukprot:scaffold216672_cov26-Attheya_sp.AAC.1